MMTMMVATAIALGLACVALLKSRVTDWAQLEQSRAALLMIGVQIICGDCSGEDEHPKKTYMDRAGNCAQCGGRSYLLASSVAASSTLSRALRMREAQISSSHGRVIPFELPASRSSRSERIAV